MARSILERRGGYAMSMRAKQPCKYSRLLFFILALQLLIPATSALSGVRRADPKRATLKIEEIAPKPAFPTAEHTESRDISPAVQRTFAKARSRFDTQLWAEAIGLLDECLKLEPGFVDARILLARAALQQGDSKLASKHLNGAIKYRPRDCTIHQLLGELAWQKGAVSEAISRLRLALLGCADRGREPPCVLAHLTLALALEKDGYLAAAADQLDAYLAAVQQPTVEMKQYRELADVISLYQGKAATMLGDICTALDQHARAASAYRRGFREQPLNKAVQQKLAMALARAAQVEAAIEIVRDGLKSSQDSASAYDLLKRICDAAGTPDRYQVELKKLVNESDDPAARLVLAEDLIKRKDEDAAADVLETHVSAHPDDLKSRMKLIRLYARQDLAEKMIPAMAELLSRSTSSYRELEHLLLGRAKTTAAFRKAAAQYAKQRGDSVPATYLHAILLAAEEPAQSKAAFESLVRKAPSFAPAQISLARLYAAGADWEQTLKTIESAVAAGVSEPDLYLLQGRAYEALDDMPAAEKALLQSFRLNSKSAEPLFVLAEAADHRRDFKRAEQLFRRILDDVDPRSVPARARLCRFYINNDRIPEAKELLEDAKSLGLKGPWIDRCNAHLDLKSGAKPPQEAEIKKYCDALEAILKKNPKDVDTLIDLANARLRTGKVPQALALTEKALSLEPLNYVAGELRTQIHYKRSDLAAAGESVQSILKQRPNDSYYQQMMLELYIDQDEYANAATIIKKLLEREAPDAVHGALMLRLLEVLQLDEKFDQLVEHSRKWLQEAPEDPVRRQIYLQALVNADRKDQAIEAAAKWLKAAPADDTLRAQYVEQLRLADRYDEAKRQVLAWLADSPDDFSLNLMLIQLFCLTKDWDSAIEVAQTGREIPDQRARFENWLGQIYLRSRKFDQAIEFYRERAQNSGAEVHQRDLIHVLMEAEHYDDAEKTANHLLQQQLDLREAGKKFDEGAVLRMRTLLALIYQRADRPQKAISQLEEIYKQFPTDPGVNNDLGYTYADLGIHLKKAEAMIRLALTERPREGAYLDSLGWVLYKQDKIAEALPLLRRAVRMQRDEPDPILLDHLADALYRSNQKEEARKIWERALEPPKADAQPHNSEERAALVRIKKKILQLDADGAVDTAPLGKPSDDAAAEEHAPSQPSKHPR